MTKNKISTGTIVRTILLLIALFNQIMTATGHSLLPIDDETVTELVSSIATIVTAVIAWWKNNSFTSNAISADEYLSELKAKDSEE